MVLLVMDYSRLASPAGAGPLQSTARVRVTPPIRRAGELPLPVRGLFYSAGGPTERAHCRLQGKASPEAAAGVKLFRKRGGSRTIAREDDGRVTVAGPPRRRAFRGGEAEGGKRGHRVPVGGAARLLDRYGIVSPARDPDAKAEFARSVVDRIPSPEGQATIAAHRVDGQQLFFPNAKR